MKVYNPKKSTNFHQIKHYRLFKFGQMMFRCLFCAFFILLLLYIFPIQNTKSPKACANPIVVTRNFPHWPMGSLSYISNHQFMLVSYSFIFPSQNNLCPKPSVTPILIMGLLMGVFPL